VGKNGVGRRVVLVLAKGKEGLVFGSVREERLEGGGSKRKEKGC